jgi:hypothetical protein
MRRIINDGAINRQNNKQMHEVEFGDKYSEMLYQFWRTPKVARSGYT